MTPNRHDQWSVSLSVDGTPWGVFDTRDGGQIDSDDVKYRPGGMAGQISLGGPVSMENVTIRRLYQLERDHVRVVDLASRVGRAACRITAQPLDADGNSFGKPIVWTGRLKRVQFPTHDSNSSDASMLEIEISTNGIPTTGA